MLVVGAGQQGSDIEQPPIGNGRAMSVLFAREGARLALSDHDAIALRESADLLATDGPRPQTIVAEAADPAAVERMVGEAAARLGGGLDGLAVNVGIVAGHGLDGTSVEDWDRVFAVDVRAHELICRHALQAMTDDASIVLISSIAAAMPVSDVVAYHAAKAALSGLCLWLAKHAAPRGIRVNLILPGLIDTVRGRLASRADPARDQRAIPLGRQGTAWEVAYAAAFLLSGEASYITGHSLVVDGGLLALR